MKFHIQFNVEWCCISSGSQDLMMQPLKQLVSSQFPHSSLSCSGSPASSFTQSNLKGPVFGPLSWQWKIKRTCVGAVWHPVITGCQAAKATSESGGDSWKEEKEQEALPNPNDMSGHQKIGCWKRWNLYIQDSLERLFKWTLSDRFMEGKIALMVQCDSLLLSAEDTFLPETKMWLRFPFTLTPL